MEPLSHKYPLVSVVVPAYNEEKFIGRTLDSFLQQSYKNFELIVVDNNSSDDTATIALSYGALLIRELKQGVANARQSGFMVAKGEIIVTTDADTIVPFEWLTEIVKKFDSQKELVAYGGLYTLHSGPKFVRFLFPIVAPFLWFIDNYLNHGWSLPGVNMAVRRDAFIKVGGFNTALRICEDADISQRLNKIGLVLLNKKFLVSTSGRRYRKGLLSAAYMYIPSVLNHIFFKSQSFNRLKPIRKESVSFIAPVFSLMMIIFIFFVFVYNSAPAKAGRQKSSREKISISSAGQIFNSHTKLNSHIK